MDGIHLKTCFPSFLSRLFFFSPLGKGIDTCHETTEGKLWPLKVTVGVCLSNKDIHIWNCSHAKPMWTRTVPLGGASVSPRTVYTSKWLFPQSTDYREPSWAPSLCAEGRSHVPGRCPQAPVPVHVELTFASGPAWTWPHSNHFRWTVARMRVCSHPTILTVVPPRLYCVR